MDRHKHDTTVVQKTLIKNYNPLAFFFSFPFPMLRMGLVFTAPLWEHFKMHQLYKSEAPIFVFPSEQRLPLLLLADVLCSVLQMPFFTKFVTTITPPGQPATLKILLHDHPGPDLTALLTAAAWLKSVLELT